MEENGRKEENERELEREHQRNGRESPVARMLEREQQEEDDDDEDTRSIASIDTIVDSQTSPRKKKQINGDVSLPLDSDATTSEPSASAPPTVSSDELARERLVLQEQNAALTARLDALSAELDEAIQLGRSLQTQHSEAFSTIKVLEEKIASLETAVEEKVEQAQGKVMRECEERWKGWKEVFEEGWRREKEGWREEREKLWQVVKDWEERKKNVELDEAGDVESDGSDEEDDEGDSGSLTTTQTPNASSSSPRSPSPKKRATRRRKRTTIVPTPSTSSSSSSSTNSIPSISRNLTSSLAPENLASDSDSTIGAGEAGSTVGGGKLGISDQSEDASSRNAGVRGSSSRTPVRFPSFLFRSSFASLTDLFSLHSPLKVCRCHGLVLSSSSQSRSVTVPP